MWWHLGLLSPTLPGLAGLSPAAMSHWHAVALARDLVAGRSIWQVGTTVWHFTPTEMGEEAC